MRSTLCGVNLYARWLPQCAQTYECYTCYPIIQGIIPAHMKCHCFETPYGRVVIVMFTMQVKGQCMFLHSVVPILRIAQNALYFTSLTDRPVQ